jgi:soluble lytic murein transglycosylase-like protein
VFHARLLAGLVCCALPLAAGAGDVFTYTEDDGTVVYTNVQPSGRKARRMGKSFTPAPAKDAPVPVPKARANTEELDGAIIAAADRYKIPRALVLAVMHTESNFNPMALSNKGASGLMQLMPGTAREMYVSDLFDKQQNIEGGVRYLRVLANRFDGDMVKMVAAYNAGPEAVVKYGGKVPPYAETQAYVKKVLGLYWKYKEKLQGGAGQRGEAAPAESQERPWTP